MAQAANMLEADGKAVPQEPVAWYEYNAGLDAWFLSYGHNPKAATRPLVFGDAAPQPQRPMLTDAEILTLWAQTYVERGTSGIEFARAIEAAVMKKVTL